MAEEKTNRELNMGAASKSQTSEGAGDSRTGGEPLDLKGIYEWVKDPVEWSKKLATEHWKEQKEIAKEIGDEIRDTYDVLTEVVKDVIPFGIDITPLDREIAKYYVTDQGRLDALNRGILYPARGRALEKQLKEKTLNQYQVDNLKHLETFMDDTLLNKVFSAEFQGFKDRKKPKTPEDIRERLRLIFMGETQLGERHRFGKLKGKLKDSPGGAVGLLQVTPETLWSVAAASGKSSQFGTTAATEAGLSTTDLNKIRKMTLPLTVKNKETLTKYLETPEVNYMAATAKIFQYLKEHNL
jgi:hypothetical protein